MVPRGKMTGRDLPALGHNHLMERIKQSPVKNQQEVVDRLSKLPEFSQNVYAEIKKALYAEPFFSDVKVEDIAARLQVSVFSINSSLSHLMDAGLVYSEEFNSNRRTQIFLHTYEHDEYQII